MSRALAAAWASMTKVALMKAKTPTTTRKTTDSSQPASAIARGSARVPVPTTRLNMKTKAEIVPYEEPTAVSPAPPRPIPGRSAELREARWQLC